MGFAVPGGQRVTVPVDHTLITGRTQQSGKTTCAEAMAHRVGCPVLTFLTKPDEKGFRDATVIPPYSLDRADWEFVVSILEASLRKPSLKKGWIMRLCEAGNFKGTRWPKPRNLAGVLANCETAMGKGGSLELTELRGYLRKVVPTMEGLEFSSKLRLSPGINVMDLRGVALPAQFLIIAAALDWVYQHGQRMIVLIPEAQKFFPREFTTPVKAAGERIIQEKGAAKVFLWLDTQMMRNVDPVLRGQMGVWLFGVQRDVNEARRTLEHIPEEPDGPPRPTLAQLQRLRRGFFIAAWGQTLVPEFYVQPFWVPDVHAQAIACGEERVDSAEEIWDERADDFSSTGSQPVPVFEGGDDEKEALTAEDAEDAEDAEETQESAGKRQNTGLPTADDDGHSRGADDPATDSGAGRTVDEGAEEGEANDPDSPLSEGEVREIGQILRDEYEEAAEAAGAARLDEIVAQAHSLCPDAEGEAMDAQEKELLELAQAMGLHNALERLRDAQPDAHMASITDSPQVGEPFAPPEGDAQGKKGAREGSGGGKEHRPDAHPAGTAATSGAPRPLKFSKLEGTWAFETSFPPNQFVTLDAIYSHVLAMARAQAPAILAVLVQQPELQIKIERPVIQLDGNSTEGRIARLLHDGFFKEGVTGSAAWSELGRRGVSVALNTVLKTLGEVAEKGFLYIEDGKDRRSRKVTVYRAVPGMKVTTK